MTAEAEEFRALYTAHYAAVLRYAWRRAGAEAAPDIAGEVFTAVWQRLDQVPRSHPLPWLYAIARNVVATYHRASERAEQLTAQSALTHTTSARDVGIQVTEQDAVRKGWAALSENDRELLALIGWEGLSITQAAAALGCSPAVCSVRLHRARARLRRQLTQHPATTDHGKETLTCA
ncbi:sigma-70 family RNA polymerase sigma factor [Streptomyces sp. NPDC051917]|uniref:RNA polymerase sigma factor n=1 Tax=Streptomyces sp. NPDC051917 TaxID=3154754 RepID=UPI003455A7A0